MSEELKEDLIELGLQRYVLVLFTAGYDDWSLLADSKSSSTHPTTASKRVLLRIHVVQKMHRNEVPLIS